MKRSSRAFQFRARQQATPIRGVIFASSPQEARKRLHLKKLQILSFKEQSKLNQRPLRDKDLLEFFLALKQILEAGIHLFQALQIMEERTRGGSLHPFCDFLMWQLEEGKELSEAMNQCSTICPSPLTSLVQAGEKGGNLLNATEEACAYLRARLKLKSNLTQSLSYPLCLLFFGSLLLTFIFLFVVPSLEDLMNPGQAGFFSRAVFSTSHFLRSYGLLIPCSFLGILLGVRAGLFKALIPYIYKTPGLRTLPLGLDRWRFCQALSSLLKAQVRLLDALEGAFAMTTTPFFQERKGALLELAQSGKAPSEALGQLELFPAKDLRLLSLGEQSGNLSTMLDFLARRSLDELQQRSQLLIQILPPLLLLLIGALVGGILWGILSPLSNPSFYQF